VPEFSRMAARPCPGSSVFERMAHEGAAPDDQLGVKLVTDGLRRARPVRLIQEHEHEIRAAWKDHFGRRGS
jgi:hypothetical protein